MPNAKKFQKEVNESLILVQISLSAIQLLGQAMAMETPVSRHLVS